MAINWNHRKGRWEADKLTDAHDLKIQQSEPVYLLDRKTGIYKEYKIPKRTRKPKIKNGKIISSWYYEDDIWD
jgi:hypothetical protein